jgi:hypothetical protein
LIEIEKKSSGWMDGQGEVKLFNALLAAVKNINDQKEMSIYRNLKVPLVCLYCFLIKV